MAATAAMSLFPEESPTRPAPVEPEPEPVLVEVEEAFSNAAYTSSEKSAGPGNGNGNGHRRFRVPSFSNDDLTIPAYIRRLEDNR